MRFANKVAFVTGAARGIGAATAELFAKDGAKVVIADLNETAGKAMAAKLPNAAYVNLDVSKEASWDNALKETIAKFGQLDILVNNAGIYQTAPLEETSMAMFVKIFEINQLGVFLGMKAAFPLLRKRGGAIVNLSSVSGFTGNQNSIAYGSTKWAVRGMTKIAAIEGARDNIRVNSVHPGLIDTPMNHEEMGHERIAEGGKRSPMGRPGKASEIAELITFLASDAASFCSGGEYSCDGAASAGVQRQRFTARAER